MSKQFEFDNWHSKAYFGLHYDLHAGLTDTELGAKLTHQHLRSELIKVKPDLVQCDCKGHAGFTSWPTEVGTPAPGIVRDALRIHRDVTRELGLPLIMHYSGVWDNQALALHPEWARVGPDGETAGKEGFVTGATCNLSAYTRELMIPQLLELIDKYQVDGFWIDGENWATRACYCQRCTSAFRESTGIERAPQTPDEPHWTEWASFHRHNFNQHVREYTEAVYAHAPHVTICSNWMYTAGQPEEITVPVDYLSGDFSWKWSLPPALLEGRFMDGRRLNHPGLSWDLMAWGFTTGESQMGGWTFKHAPGLCQEAGAVITLGGSFLIYNQPQRSGHLTGWQQEIMAEVGRFCNVRRQWCHGTESASQTAVLHHDLHFQKGSRDVLMAAWSGAQKPVNGALHALLENHVSVDVVNAATLEQHLQRYKLVVIAEQELLPESLVLALRGWVEAGGRLVLGGTANVAHLADLAGIEVAGEEKAGFLHIPVGHETTTVRGPWLPVAATDARVLVHTLDHPDPAFNRPELPAATLRDLGQGRVAAVPGPLFSHFAETHYPRTRLLVGQIIAALEPALQVTLEGPARVHLMVRRSPGKLIAHLLNTGAGHPLAPEQVMVEDVPRAGPLTLRIQWPQRPTSIYLAPTMEGLQWDYAAGTATVRVDSIGILDSVVVEFPETTDN